jgi:hypothetical protein
MSRYADAFFIWGIFAWGVTCAWLGYQYGIRVATGRYQDLLQPKEEDIAAKQIQPARQPGRRMVLRRVKSRRD